MVDSIRLISSMATRALLAELAAQSPVPVALDSVGGVDAARRVQSGDAFDGVVLAANAIDKLILEGHALAPRFDLAVSGVAVAVRHGMPEPAIDCEAALREAVLSAESVGYSTGPSGTALLALFGRWGIRDQLEGRLVQAPPGVPVGSLVAEGQVGLGFQQYSELMALPGITVIGGLPPAVAIDTVFSAAVTACSARPAAVRDLFAAWAAPEAAAVKQRHGMQPA